MRVVRAEAPSNIALIKYMGKADSERNVPANSSLSVTLSALRTVTELFELSGPPQARSVLHWSDQSPEIPSAGPAMRVARFTPDLPRLSRHFERVRERLPRLFSRFALKLREASGSVELRTANTFPASSGIASSASGFAALTLASAAFFADEVEAFRHRLGDSPEFVAELASLSREGSGSSCRSFHGPFVAWEGESVRRLDSSALPALAHFVLIISTEPKKVSSSEAHARVKSSPVWVGRPERANARLAALESAILRGDLAEVAGIAWRESWEMHALFQTSDEPFHYFEPGTIEARNFLAPFLEGPNPPIVTQDAGPNLHVLVRAEDRAIWRTRLEEALPSFRLLEDAPGVGAQVLS